MGLRCSRTASAQRAFCSASKTARRALANSLQRSSGLNRPILLSSPPIRPLLTWAIRRKIKALPLFLDSFRDRGLKARLQHWLLARVLNDGHFPWVANHHIAASNDLARIGVDRAKILPFDWPPLVTPDAYPAKQGPSQTPFKLIYVGSLIQA
jgi:hypothetical protein